MLGGKRQHIKKGQTDWVRSGLIERGREKKLLTLTKERTKIPVEYDSRENLSQNKESWGREFEEDPKRRKRSS